MIDKDNQLMLQKLRDAWGHVQTELQRLHPNASVRPNDITVFDSEDDADVTAAYFKLKPVVFNVPERATHGDLNLFVVVEGRVSYQRAAFKASKELRTSGFSTQVAYFRRKRTVLEHVYGAHYDFAPNDKGHPAFHSQIKSFAQLAQIVRDQYKFELPDEDRVKGILKTIRTPTAQMDVFSVFVQLCADHLLHEDSAQSEVSAFDTLLTKNGFCVGAAFQLPRLASTEAQGCYRARHWYPIGPDAAQEEAAPVS